MRTHILPLTNASPVGDRPLSLTEQIHERMREEILNATWRPGDFVLEAELALRYGVSKTPVREALRLLSQQGWILTIPRKGYLVRTVRFEDIREVFELRLLIEPGLFALATRSRDVLGQNLESLRTLVSSENNADFGDNIPHAPGREFHLAVARIAGNSRATDILTGLLDEVRRLHQILPDVQTHPPVSDVLLDHQAIFKGVEDGDAELVAKLVRDHIQDSADRMMDAFRLSID